MLAISTECQSRFGALGHTAEGAPKGGLVGKEHNVASGALILVSTRVFFFAHWRFAASECAHIYNVRSSRDECAACKQTGRTSGARAHGWERRPYYKRHGSAWERHSVEEVVEVVKGEDHGRAATIRQSATARPGCAIGH